jgi:hypothetical protein
MIGRPNEARSFRCYDSQPQDCLFVTEQDTTFAEFVAGATTSVDVFDRCANIEALSCWPLRELDALDLNRRGDQRH